MTTVWPGGLDDFTNPTDNDTLDGESGGAGVVHSTQHAQVNAAVEAIETFIGTTGSPGAELAQTVVPIISAFSIASLSTKLAAAVAANGGVSASLQQGSILGSTPLIVPQYTKLAGQGKNFFGTCIQITSGDASDGVQMLEGNGTTINAFFCTLRDFMIDVNGQHAPAGSYNNGLTCLTNPFNTKAAGDPDFDPQHLFDNLYIKNASGEGMYFESRGVMTFLDVWVEDCLGTGIIPPFDSQLVACKTQNGGIGGILIPYSDMDAVACNSYNNGTTTPLTLLTVAGSGESWTITYSSMSTLNANTFTVTVPAGTTAPISLGATGATVAAAISAIAGFSGTCTGTGQLQGVNGANTVTLTFSASQASLTVTNAQSFTVGQHAVYNGILYYAINALTNYNANPSVDTTNWGTFVRPFSGNSICPEWGYGYYFYSETGQSSFVACNANQNAAGGVYFLNSVNVIFSGNLFDINANPFTGSVLATNPNNYAAVTFDNATGCEVNVTISNAQYAVRIINGAAGNTIRISGTPSGSLFSPDTSAAAIAANTVYLNGSLVSGTEMVNNVVAAAGATQTLALVANDITLSANLTAAMPTAVRGAFLYGIFRQAASGGPYTVALTSVKWPGGTPPTMSTGANAVDRYDFVSDGAHWYGVITGQAFT